MSKKGYGNVKPRFAKYFARHKNSSGAHDPKNAKQQAQSEQAIEDMASALDALYEAGNLCADVYDTVNGYDAVVLDDVYDNIDGYGKEELDELRERYERKEDCPVCGQFTRLNVYNMIIGYVCSVDCLVGYWEGTGHE